MEPDKQPPQNLQVDQPAISSQETMSNNIEDGTSDDNQLPKSLIPTIGIEFASIEEESEDVMAREVMSKVEELVLEERQSDQIDDNRIEPRNEVSRVNLEATSAKPTGIRKKTESEESGRHRYPSSLETNKKTRKIDKSTNISNSRSTEMSPNANFGGHDLIYSQTSELTETHSYGYATGLLNAIHALSTTNTSLQDSQITT